MSPGQNNATPQAFLCWKFLGRLLLSTAATFLLLTNLHGTAAKDDAAPVVKFALSQLSHATVVLVALQDGPEGKIALREWNDSMVPTEGGIGSFFSVNVLSTTEEAARLVSNSSSHLKLLWSLGEPIRGHTHWSAWCKRIRTLRS